MMMNLGAWCDGPGKGQWGEYRPKKNDLSGRQIVLLRATRVYTLCRMKRSDLWAKERICKIANADNWHCCSKELLC